MKNILLAVMLLLPAAALGQSFVEVSGTATLDIVPDRITVEIGMQEYYRHGNRGDSTLVTLNHIEKEVRRVLSGESIPDSAVTLADVGNSLDPARSKSLLMAKRLSVVLHSFDRLESLASAISLPGVNSFSLARIDNSRMADYNRRGLKAALDAAKNKAAFIAADAGLILTLPVEIVENGPGYYESPSFSNVSLQYDGAMDSMRRIVRRYSVRVKYGLTTP